MLLVFSRCFAWMSDEMPLVCIYKNRVVSSMSPVLRLNGFRLGLLLAALAMGTGEAAFGEIQPLARTD